LDAHALDDQRALGLAVDSILVLPAQSLVRTRDGRRRTRNAIRTRLRTVAAARAPVVPGWLPPHGRGGSLHVGSPAAFSELAVWKAKVRRAVERARAGKTKRCVDVLTQDGMASWTGERISHMRAKHPPATNVAPDCPADAPSVFVDPKDLDKLVRSLANFTAAGPSGWTAELLLPLLDDEVCMQGITLLTQLIANNQLDSHSRNLLTCSLLNAIPKSDGGLRPLALGEFFVKLACKYCFALDAVNFPGIFEPIQLAICCPGGSERAVLTFLYHHLCRL
jgi:hypothetical protein